MTVRVMGTPVDLHRTIPIVFDSLDLDFSSAHGDENIFNPQTSGEFGKSHRRPG